MTLLISTLQQHHWFSIANIFWLVFMLVIFLFGFRMPRVIKAVNENIQEAKAHHDARSHEREEYP